MSGPHHKLENPTASAAGLAPEHTHCANCGAELMGPYCHQCGQSSRHMLRHLPALASDATDALLNIDGRLMQTLPALFFKPGFLANEYFAGRRTRYIPPFRLMFFMSVLTFLVIHLVVNLAPSVDKAVTPAPITTSHVNTAGPSHPHHVHFDNVHASWLPGFAANRINASVQQAAANINDLSSASRPARRHAWRRIFGGFVAVAPQTLFVLIPLLALLLKLVYAFKSRLYIEHLIVALYSQAFIYLTLLLSVLLAVVAGALPDWAHTPVGLLQAALWIWLAAHLLVAQKRIYAQGWLLTVVKYGCTGICYCILLSFALLVAVLISLAS